MENQAEILRLLNNIVRPGQIAEVDYAHALCRVTVGDNTTDWLPFFTRRAATTRTWDPPRPLEQAVVLSPGGDLAQGFVLVGVYQDAFPAPSADPDIDLVVYPDGTSLQYDSKNHKLTAAIQGSADITTTQNLTAIAGGDIHATAVGDLTATASNISATAASSASLQATTASVTATNITLTGNVTINGPLALNGPFIAGPGSGGGGATFNGDFTLNGNMATSGSLTNNGVNIGGSHFHDTPSGQSGGPQ